MSPAQKLTDNLKGGAWHQSYGTAPCPSHDDSRPSLSIRDGERGVILKCHAGCTSSDVVASLRRLRLWPASGDATEPRATLSAADKRDAALRIWREARAIGGTIAEMYMRNRGITSPLPPTLRYAGALLHRPTGLRLPAMVAAVQAPTREVAAVHRTFLTITGKKAPVSEPKMGLGSYGGGAVRLAAAEIELGLAEGIETAISAMQLFQMPVWASLGGERLAKVKLPADVARVVVLGDNGPAGHAAAMKAVETYTRQGRQVTLRFPPDDYKDFNDLLCAQVKA